MKTEFKRASTGTGSTIPNLIFCFLLYIAGVTKRIKIYNYNTVLKDTVDIHYPCVEMVCGSKISCVAWSAFHQNTLASSDYDCTVIVWDALTASKVRNILLVFYMRYLVSQ